MSSRHGNAFLQYWSFVSEIHCSRYPFSHALCSVLSAWTGCWTNSWVTANLRYCDTHVVSLLCNCSHSWPCYHGTVGCICFITVPSNYKIWKWSIIFSYIDWYSLTWQFKFMLANKYMFKWQCGNLTWNYLVLKIFYKCIYTNMKKWNYQHCAAVVIVRSRRKLCA